MIRIFVLILFLGISLVRVNGQDKIEFSSESNLLNRSIANYFSIAEDPSGKIKIDDILRNPDTLKFVKMSASMANLDFTTSNFWVRFELTNSGPDPLNLILETARPITNLVRFYEATAKGFRVQQSGDQIDFSLKSIKSNKSLFEIYLPAKATKKYWLQLGSDGEIISLPIIFWEKGEYDYEGSRNVLFTGVFYGIFIFVIIIYLTFYFILHDSSFLYYVLYVFFSGFMQFSLDGYTHQYLFSSGGYFTQHSVIVGAGLTVFFVLLYSSTYLHIRELNSKLFIIFKVFMVFVLINVTLSLIPGVFYRLSYPSINGLSLISTFLVLVSAVVIGRSQKKVHPLFIGGIVILIFGAFIFILGNFSVIDAPALTQSSLKIATLIEILCLSMVMAGKYKVLQEEKEEAQAKLLVELEGINEKLEVQVKERTAQIEYQNRELEQKNKDITDSIVYAERIQRAILPSDSRFKSLLPDSFVFYQPRDIVSGDFYWIQSLTTTSENPKRLIVYATADCTGHGVPGAFVSIVGNNLLNLSKNNPKVNTPSEALQFINAGINQSFNQENNETIRDGMDIALCAIDLDGKSMLYAGAKNPLYVIRGNELFEYKANKFPIGYIGEVQKEFTDNHIELKKGDILYTFTDGFADQFGGEGGKKYKYKNFKSFLLSISHLNMDEQKVKLKEEFEAWKHGYEQLDDVLIIGVKI